jgi:DNA-binding response OmpR family regulator
MKENANVLIVEDEHDIAEILKVQLETSGHNVTLIHDGSEALEFIQEQSEEKKIDLYILDRMLPGTTGLEICKFLRMFKKTKAKPILMLTAMTLPEQVIEGLEAGADDYVTKPFDINILKARVKNLLRRSQLSIGEESSEEAILAVKGLKIDTNQCKVWIDENELDLTLSEYKLLVTFLKQPGKVLTRNSLIQSIQDGPVHVTDRTIDTHIFGLRKKLGDYSKFIETIRGIGYRVVAND